jgi:hypothetical protein
MSWTTPADLRSQVQKLWDKGQILASIVGGQTLFPRRLMLKRPTSAEMTNRFEEVRAWIVELRQGTHYRVVMRELRHQILGSNSIPDEVWIDTLDDALNLIGKTRDAKRFAGLVALTREQQPVLLVWLEKHPLKAMDLIEDWPRLIEIVGWMQANPRPGIYIRQIDIPGIHTKFVESHRSVLMELLDLTLTPGSINFKANGATQLCSRYGLLDKPLRIRFRILDPDIAILPLGTDQDITVNQEGFNSLNLNIDRVFITENEINFLAFPHLANSIVVFGAGYGFEMLAQAKWFHQCSIHYWGDIDTHGFAILDQLRSYFPLVESFLMDRQTLMTHKLQWGIEPQPLRRDLVRLNSEERSLFDDLRDNKIGLSIRLEQERIAFGWIKHALNS